MDDRSQDGGSRQLQGGQTAVRSSQWFPKPEQILILQTIFDSGMINPPKEETVRIRKLLEKFGWFQNRRSRSRRRQRQIEASLGGIEAQAPPWTQGGAGIINPYDNFVPSALSYPMSTGSCVTGSTSSPGPDHAHYSGEFLSFLGQSDLQVQEQNPLFCSPVATHFPYQSEVITVFINGVAMEVGREGLDIKMFHSLGVPIQVNEYGCVVQDLLKIWGSGSKA